jgi:hypothetical protein
MIMKEINQLTRFRDQVPLAVTPRAEQMFRIALEEEISSERRAVPPSRPGIFRRALTGRRPAWRYTVAAGAAAGLAAGILVATQSSGQAPLTVQLLADRASAAALAQPAVPAKQWVYGTVEIKNDFRSRLGLPSENTESGWQTADATATYDDFEEGIGPGSGIPSYAQLGSLPRNPAALDAYLAHLSYPNANATQANKDVAAFSGIEQMMFSYVLPPAVEAEMYQALADIPTVQVNDHATDITGRAGSGFVLPETSQSETLEIILDASSYKLLAEASWQPSDGKPHSAIGLSEWAILKQVLVAGPGLTRPDSAPPSPAEVLAAQADYAGSWSQLPPLPPESGDWVYRRLVTSSGSRQIWATAGDTEQAQYNNGTLQVCERSAACAASTQWLMPAGPSYALVNPVQPRGRPFRRVNARLVRTKGYKFAPTLPGTLSALLTKLNSYDTGCTHVSGDCNAVNVVANMLFGYDVPFGTPVNWYLLLGEIPGASAHAMTDVTGQADIAFEFPYNNGVTAILLDEHTYQFAGYVKNGVQTIVAKQSIVSGPGVQP